jgi:hypothetical protein
MTISGGRFKDFETLKLLPKNLSAGKPKSFATGNMTQKTAKSTAYGNGPIKTTNLGSMGLTQSDMTSLRDGDIFQDAMSIPRSRATPKRYRLDSKRKYLKKIMNQTHKVQKSFLGKPND